MQLFSVDQQRSQALEAHAASFAQFKVCLFMILCLLSYVNFIFTNKYLYSMLLSYNVLEKLKCFLDRFLGMKILLL